MADVNTDQSLPFTLAITNQHGNPAQVQGVPSYASSDETVVTVVPADDGMSGTVMTVAPSDTPVRITVTADADLGSGVLTVTGVSEDINVTKGASFMASNFTFTFGAPVAKA